MFQKQKKGTTYNRGDVRYLHKKSVNPINYPRIKLYHWSIYTHIAHTYLHIYICLTGIYIYIYIYQKQILMMFQVFSREG